MQFDVIPDLPEIMKLSEIDEEQALNEFRDASHKFMFYENELGEVRFLFEKLDAATYACLVAKLSSYTYNDLFEFMKLVIEGARLVRMQNEKGWEKAGRIGVFLKNNKKEE